MLSRLWAIALLPSIPLAAQSGAAPGKLDYAHRIAFDPADGSLYTAEIKNWRVQKWVRQ
ncbi:MAG TPA: hypothetical protein VKJ01_04990 [Candidatus Solibacter sp.]|nr:hypothetical protein [Candidatus Solibacter sp.]